MSENVKKVRTGMREEVVYRKAQIFKYLSILLFLHYCVQHVPKSMPEPLLQLLRQVKIGQGIWDTLYIKFVHCTPFIYGRYTWKPLTADWGLILTFLSASRAGAFSAAVSINHCLQNKQAIISTENMAMRDNIVMCCKWVRGRNEGVKNYLKGLRIAKEKVNFF